jgi:hypothetical protein
MSVAFLVLWYDVVSLVNDVDNGKTTTYGLNHNSENQKKRAKLIHGVDANTV